ncbi:clathrin light chain domain-containing protein [Rhizoctonia solani AG-1 IA]|uniref:Clathrin light chain n=1 Tax=Thanatephorus cucumeris (strain AG1-IA) TaxID=983506 RepID=L8WI16_THACA|nr:clathrin light chain domain-containing protein [Rhizoctonia solani AG-1 IA]
MRRVSESVKRPSLEPRKTLTSSTRTIMPRRRGLFARTKNEAEFLSSLTDSLSTGTTWSRICDLIDLENSQSKTVARPGVDLTRYREVLLKLRKQGDKAPGAAGY